MTLFNRPIITLSSMFLALMLAQGLPATGEKAPPWQLKVDPQLLQKARTGELDFLVLLSEKADVSDARKLRTKSARGAHVFRRLKEVSNRTQAPILKLLRARGLAHRPFWLANMIWVRGDIAAIQLLSRRADVLRIVANPSVQLQEPSIGPAGQSGVIEWNITKVRAPEVWALGYTGQGVVIGGQDTGYQWNHPALIGKYRGWNGTTADHNYNWHDAIHTNDIHHSTQNPTGYDTKVPCDDLQHGTHTMGTMVGDDGGANQIGMAPGAKWIGCRNMDRNWGTPATYTECFEWLLAPTDLNNQNPDPSKAPDVINNSWYCPPAEGAIDPLIMQDVVESLRAAGIVVVASAGNDGPSASSIRYPPAIYASSFSVGATDINDTIAGFSSRGPVTVDGSGRIKPDISAPGVSIRSSVPGSTYAGGWQGTSMAGPHVAGLVALLISAHPELRGQVDAIERIIEQTAVPLGGAVPNNNYGWGRIDAVAALGLGDSDTDGMPDWWEIWRGFSRSNAADAALDADGDGLSNLEEYLSGTDPNDPASVLRITTTQPSGTNVFTFFTTVTGKIYCLECTDDLLAPSWKTAVSNMSGTGTVFQVSDPDGASATQRFYRIKLGP